MALVLHRLLGGDPVLRLIRRLIGLPVEPRPDTSFVTVVYDTAPDPALWMTERERRYHQSTHFNR